MALLRLRPAADVKKGPQVRSLSLSRNGVSLVASVRVED